MLTFELICFKDVSEANFGFLLDESIGLGYLDSSKNIPALGD